MPKEGTLIPLSINVGHPNGGSLIHSHMAKLPPGPKMPALMQLLSWILRPVPFMENCIRRYGDWFTIRFPGIPPFVLTSDPRAVKEVFSGRPEKLHSGAANRILKPTVGGRSILLADGENHLRLRKLMIPPLLGVRMRSFAIVMVWVSKHV